MKLYIKRNTNELAELVFQNDELLDYSSVYHFAAKYHELLGDNSKLPNFFRYFKFNDRYYLGECDDSQLKILLTNLNDRRRATILPHLEIVR